MDVWLYTGANGLHAITSDVAGANLPDNLGPWFLNRAVTLQASMADEQEAITLIAEHGYCCFEGGAVG